MILRATRVCRSIAKSDGGGIELAEADAYGPSESFRLRTFFLYIKHWHIAWVAGAASLRDATPAFIRVLLKLSTFGSSFDYFQPRTVKTALGERLLYLITCVYVFLKILKCAVTKTNIHPCLFVYILGFVELSCVGAVLTVWRNGTTEQAFTSLYSPGFSVAQTVFIHRLV